MTFPVYFLHLEVFCHRPELLQSLAEELLHRRSVKLGFLVQKSLQHSASISQQRRGNSERMRTAEPGSDPLCCWRLRPTVWKEIKMQLHFSRDAVPDSVSGDFHNLNKFTEQVKGPQTSRSSAARSRTQDGFRPVSGPHKLQLKF